MDVVYYFVVDAGPVLAPAVLAPAVLAPAVLAGCWYAMALGIVQGCSVLMKGGV